MSWSRVIPRLLAAAAACAAAVYAGDMGGAIAQQPAAAAAGQAQQGRTGGPGGVTASFFTLVDANKDGAVTRDELKATFDGWYTQWDASKGNALTLEQIFMGLNAMLPAPAGAAAPPQNRTPRPEDVAAMMAALPDRAPATPKQPRKVLVLGKAAGFVHSSIPLAARTIEEIGKKTGAWSTTITYDPADINEQNLRQYDAIFLASTTGAFLDDPNDAAATAARRKALLEFVRGGKGLAGIHAATDSYHQSSAQPAGGRGGAINFDIVPIVMQVMSGDANHDGKLSREEFAGVGDTWFEKLDPGKSGRIARADFAQRFAALPPVAPPAGRGGGNGQAAATDLGPDTQVGTWPEFNRMIGGFFKFHWNDGQTITVKIDEPSHPLNAAFKGQEYVIVDETYTFGRDTYSRQNLRVLTSIDYAKMSAQDKAKEQNPRPDGDYALSWIRREGKGRVFYEAHGHNEKVYANRLLLEHVTAGMQYVLGDLQADDSPSQAAPSGAQAPSAAQAPAAGPPPNPNAAATAEDHRNMMEQLGIKALRPGPSGNESAPNHANYDETLANPYPNLPDALTLKNGTKVTSADVWWKQRRPEIVEDFDREVLGRVPKNVPKVAWRVNRTEKFEVGGRPVIGKELIGAVDNSAYPDIAVEIQMTLVTPATETRPVPVMMMFGGRSGMPPAPGAPPPAARGFGPGRGGPGGGAPLQGPSDPPATEQLIAGGWGYATISPASIQADNGAGLTKGIIGLVNKGQRRRPEDWGALRAWAWGASRGLDYLETDKAVDAKKVGIEGVSRFGKAALVTMAYDQRFAVVLIGSSGEGGAKLHRRNFGEAVENLTGSGEYHWMAGNFLKYGTEESSFGRKTAGDIPVDAHELLALCAPRLTFVSYGIPERGDARWLDHQGSYMAAVAAQPVFRLLGAKGLGVSDDYTKEKMPAVNVGLLDGQLAWRQHDGGHTDGPNWKYFIPWADRFLKHSPAASQGSRE